MNPKETDRDFSNSEVVDGKEAELEEGLLMKKEEPPIKSSYMTKKKTILTQSRIDFIQKRQAYNKLSYYLMSFYAGLSSITELAVSYHFKDVLKIQPAKLSQLTSAIVLPWSLKPLLGLLTDCCPIFGYKRKIYILLCGLLAMLCWFGMATYEPTLLYSVLFLFLINIANSFSSVLSEAIVVELARDKTSMGLEQQTEQTNTNNQERNNEEHHNNSNSHEDKDYSNRAKDYVSIFMIFKYSGVLFSSFMKGSLVESIGIRGVFLVGTFLPLLVILAGIIMIDVKVKQENRNTNNNSIDPEQENPPRNQNYQTISETGGIGTNNNNNDNNNNNAIQATQESQEESTTPSFNEMLAFICQTQILLPIMFIILFMATPSYSDPFFYFLTNKLNFTATSLGKVSFCSTIGVLFGIFVYKTWFKEAKFRNVIVFCTIMSFTFSFSGYLLVNRYNLKLGINDFWMVLLSNSVLSMLGEIMLLPLLSIACVLCPKNMEGTIFSVFMSALNFGGTLSSLFGSFLTSYLGISSTNFDNLSCLILIANIMSLMPLPLLFCLNEKYFKH